MTKVGELLHPLSSTTTVDKILMNGFKYNRVCARWVPMLTDQHKKKGSPKCSRVSASLTGRR